MHPFSILLIAALLAVSACRASADEAFARRGYYVTFMRMPTFGLPEWKRMVDCIEQDGGNTLILWTAGAFRSKRFPITWKYNADHKNVESDYVRELIDYAHTKEVQVLLGFTPFAYDGVNQFTLEHPELKATQRNGDPAHFWGMHSWGYNLCPAKPDSQRFMIEYVREMMFDFYPNADGLLIESSDYAICHCAQCREKFFDHEFKFVRTISDEVWRARSNAVVMVYPSYFNGRAVPGFDVRGAKQPFDPRWTLFFTPHSAHIDNDLLKQANGSVYSDKGISLGTPSTLRDGARTAHKHGVTGYVPSCEPFSCIDGPPGSNKPRQKPFHFEWLRDGEIPLNELLMRVNRLAYREYTRDPNLEGRAWRAAMQKEFFSGSTNEALIDDLLFLHASWFDGADWFTAAPLLRPGDVKRQAEREKWPAARMQTFTDRVEKLRALAKRYEHATGATEREMHRIAMLIVKKWDLNPPSKGL